jgi:hypothetical protein
LAFNIKELEAAQAPPPAHRETETAPQDVSTGRPEQLYFDQRVYRDIVLDHRRVSDGAFRLWHYLRSRANKIFRTWPSQNTICKDIGCKKHSLKKWTDELIAAGYLRVRTVGRDHHFEYLLLSGDGKGSMPEWAAKAERTRMDTEVAMAKTTPREKDSRCLKGHRAMPQTAPRRGAQMGTVSNSTEVNPISEFPLPQFESVKTGLWPAEYDALISLARREMKPILNDPRFTVRIHGVLSPKWQMKIQSKHSEMKAIQDVPEPTRTELQDKCRTEIAVIRENPANWQLGLNKQGMALMECWDQRINEIEMARSGQRKLF